MGGSEAPNNRWKLVDHVNAILAIIVSLIAIGGAIFGVVHFGVASSGPKIGQPSPTATGAPTPLPTATPTSSSGSGPYEETAGGEASTWTNYINAGGIKGPTIAAQQSVLIACKVTGFKVPDGNTWWYRIASSPWNNKYYVSADAMYNNGATSGGLLNTPWVDTNVVNC